MNFKNHIYFAIICVFLSKKLEITSTLSKGDLCHIILGASISSIIPDIDHPISYLGKKIKFISKFIIKYFGHRGITHSFIGIIIFNYIININFFNINLISKDILHSMNIGYISHIIFDSFTFYGIKIFWPLSYRLNLFKIYLIKKKKIFLILFFLIIFFFPINIIY